MRLSDVTCRTTKPSHRLQKLSDGAGLQLWVQPNGAKHWRFAYRFGGKQKLLALGAYPLVTLANARTGRDAAKRLLIDGVDPSAARKEQRIEQASEQQTFRVVAEEYVAKLKKEGRTEKSIYKVEWLLTFAYAVIGDRPVAAVKPSEILLILRKLEARGHYHSAHRLRSTMSAIFRLAIATARAESDPTIALRDALVAYVGKPRPAIVLEKPFGALLRAIDTYDGHAVTRIALNLMALLFPRPGELRRARWPEFDFDDAVWNVPAERMKGRKAHFVPLSRQAVELLRELQTLTEGEQWLFPGVGNRDRCISDATLNAALRRMGFDTQKDHCCHGFRSSASTMLNESGKFHADAIERQLAHIDQNSTRAAYARGEFWQQRVELMRWWADRCDEMRNGGNVVKLRA